jgi:hypothetical protein
MLVALSSHLAGKAEAPVIVTGVSFWYLSLYLSDLRATRRFKQAVCYHVCYRSCPRNALSSLTAASSCIPATTWL